MRGIASRFSDSELADRRRVLECRNVDNFNFSNNFNRSNVSNISFGCLAFVPSSCKRADMDLKGWFRVGLAA